jgi:DNA topoisomerase-1
MANSGLRFADVSAPGFSRRRTGRGWCFLTPEGAVVRCAETRARLLAVGLPPAYREAWYCPDPDGHIQAHGVDARGRRQYRYHPAFRMARETAKFESLLAFGLALPQLRARVARALARPTLSQDRVVAAVVRLLDLGALRVGNARYARDNRSFGATTLRRRHAAVKGGTVMLQFRAKGGVARRVTLSDASLARVVRRCQDLPGQQLFAFEDAAGDIRPVTSGHVNDWLRLHAGDGMTAKSFRTWWGSVIGLAYLAEHPGSSLAAMLDEVSARLGNTRAVARQSYVHPAVIAVARGELPLPTQGRGPRRLQPAERRLVALLQQAGAAPG